MAEPETEIPIDKTKKRVGLLRRLGRLALYGLVVLAGFLLWLNGPGMRWLGPKVAEHFIGKAGMEGSLRLGGTLLGGVEVYDLEISGKEGAVERIMVERLVTDYRFMEVIKGKVRGISGKGIRAEIRVVPSVDEEKPPLDFAALGKTLAGVREKILPLALDLEDVSFMLRQEGERVVELEDSDFSHKPGEDEIRLELGRVIAPDGKFTQKQKAELVWEESGLTLDKLELLPMAGMRNIAVMLPEDGAIAAEAMIRLGGAMLRLDVGAGVKDVRLDLIEGELDFGKLLGGFGLGFPVKGRLTSLAVDLEKVYPQWQAGVGMAEVFVEGFSYDGWEVPELSAGLALEDKKFSARLAGKALGSDFRIGGGGEFKRAALVGDGFVTDGISGDLDVDRLGELLRALDKKLDLGGRFAEFPESGISGKWSVDKDLAMDVDLLAKAADAEVSTIRLDAGYAGKIVTLHALETEGRKISGTFDTETQGYAMREEMDGFRTESIAPWLKGAGVELPGAGVFSLVWENSGNLLSDIHKGELRGFSGEWKWADAGKAPIMASGAASYDWPGKLSLEGFAVETEGQTLKLDAELAGNGLELKGFTWIEGGDVLAKGRGRLPVPEDLSGWKTFLETDARPLALTLVTETLPLAKLRPWVKGLEQLDDKATGKVDLKIAGSLTAPEVDAVVEIRDVGVAGKPDIPLSDVTLKVKARDGRAAVSAEAVAKDYAPATLTAEMAFLPRKWAEDTESLKAEAITGTLDLPRVELSRFQSLIPGAEELGGVTEGRLTIAGTVGAPDVDGRLKLFGGKLRMKGSAIPPLDGISLEVAADLETLEINGGIADIAGGDLKISGNLDLKNEAGDGLGGFELSVKGTGLPIVRNDFLIMRANADLRLAGVMADAKLSGEIGIIDSVFFKDMDLIPIGKPFLSPSAAALPKVDAPENPGAAVPAPFSEWTVDVVVKTIDPILIRGNLGAGRVEAALRIGGTLGDPKPNGKVRVAELVARLPFSTLQIREGLLNFTPQTGFDPVLEIRGTSEPRPYRVQIYAYGKASDPQLLLTSQPPLPENEIMTLLATGTTAAGLEDSQAASSRAMQLLIEEMRKGRFLFGKQLRPVLGLLDNVDFSLAESDPYDSDSYTSATLKLSEKWFLSAGLGEEGDQRFMAIWRLRFR
ncbi:translocation/assembly module TamB domain-containing protein [Akkermansiaceae bacterium]|nr:translocation/assembly module TamB domain-containing protein [Akkermansiaceae bacterium]